MTSVQQFKYHTIFSPVATYAVSTMKLAYLDSRAK